jgi:alpha-tubulin suppressor-like RCC1 family protein
LTANNKVSAGEMHSLVIVKGTVYVFGAADNGKLGKGKTDDIYTPTPITIPNNKKIVSVSCGYTHSILLADDGTVFTFGSAANGVLGNDATSPDVLVPTAISIPDNIVIVAIAAGARHSILLAENGTVFTFGNPTNYRLGNKDASTPVLVPTAITIPGGKKIVSISAGSDNSILLAADGSVLTFGNANLGKLGNQQPYGYVTSPTAISIPSNKKIAAIATGTDNSILLGVDGTVYTFGYGSLGNLGNGLTSLSVNSATAITIPGNKKIVDISVGNDHSILLADDNTVFTYGSAQNGQLGNGLTSPNVLSPEAITIPGNKTIVAISGGYQYSILLSKDNAVITFGAATSGKLGNGAYYDSYPNPDVVMGVSVCYGIRDYINNVCNGHGTCQKLNYCCCQQPYAGHDCKRLKYDDPDYYQTCYHQK